MANKTVVIDCDEQGQYSVGEKPAMEPGADMDGGMGRPGTDMQPVESLDQALEMARGIFAAEDVEQEEAADAEFDRGYSKVPMMDERMGGMK